MVSNDNNKNKLNENITNKLNEISLENVSNNSSMKKSLKPKCVEQLKVSTTFNGKERRFYSPTSQLTPPEVITFLSIYYLYCLVLS